MSDQVERYKTLENGAVYDMEAKRIVKGAALSSAQASALAYARIEKRREVIREAANKHDKSREHIEKFGEFAFVAAITQASMTKATDPSDSKQVEAARFLLVESGESESKSQNASIPVGEFRGLLRDLAGAARAIEAARSAGG